MRNVIPVSTAHSPSRGIPAHLPLGIRTLLSIQWDKKPPAPRLPADVVATTAKKYEEALERLTGHGVQ